MPKHITEDELVDLITARVEAGLLSQTILSSYGIYIPPPPTARRVDNFKRTTTGLGTPDLGQFGPYQYGPYLNNDVAQFYTDGEFARSTAQGTPGDYSMAALPYGSTNQDVTFGVKRGTQETSNSPGDGHVFLLHVGATRYQSSQRFDTIGIIIDAGGNFSASYYNVNGSTSSFPVTQDWGTLNVPGDENTHAVRVKYTLNGLLQVSVDGTSDSDLHTVASNLPGPPNSDGNQPFAPGPNTWVGFDVNSYPDTGVDYIDFNYPGVFYNPQGLLNGLTNATFVDFRSVVTQSGQQWHGDVGYQLQTTSGLVFLNNNYPFSNRVVLTADSRLKDGAGVKTTWMNNFGLVCKDQSSVVYPGNGSNVPPTTGSALLVASDGLYYVIWDYIAGSQQATQKLVGWPDNSYNFQPGDEVFVIFGNNLVEVRRNNVPTITGFDYMAALAGMTVPDPRGLLVPGQAFFPAGATQGKILPGEADAIRNSTDFGFALTSDQISYSLGAFTVLP